MIDENKRKVRNLNIKFTARQWEILEVLSITYNKPKSVVVRTLLEMQFSFLKKMGKKMHTTIDNSFKED